MINVVLPLRLVNGSNERGHWGIRHRRAQAHRKATIVIPRYPLPCIVTLTRIAPNALDDDGLVISAKHVRDGIAKRLGVDDASPLVQWRYRQERGTTKQYGVRVQIEDVGDAA